MARAESVGKLQAEHFAAATVRPGDTLVVGFAGSLDAATSDRVKRGIEELLPGVDVVLVAGVSQMLVYQPHEARAEES